MSLAGQARLDKLWLISLVLGVTGNCLLRGVVETLRAEGFIAEA